MKTLLIRMLWMIVLCDTVKSFSDTFWAGYAAAILADVFWMSTRQSPQLEEGK